MFSLVHVVTKLTMFLDLRSLLGNCRIVNQLFDNRIMYFILNTLEIRFSQYHCTN